MCKEMTNSFILRKQSMDTMVITIPCNPPNDFEVLLTFGSFIILIGMAMLYFGVLPMIGELTIVIGIMIVFLTLNNKYHYVQWKNEIRR